MTKIIASILAFLLWIFPNWSSLQNRYELLTFSWETTASNIVNAIEGGDIAALEAMMCRNIKQNAVNLPSKIGELIDAIDGEIVDFTWETYGGLDANHGSGKSLSQRHLDIHFKTTSVDNYTFLIIWEYSNSFQLEEKGIRAIVLMQKTPPYTALADIRATNGVGEWHE